jgi:uncharacterized membrane protein
LGLETSNLREVLGSMFVSSAKHPIDRAPFMLVSIPIPQKVNSIATNGLMIHNDSVLFQAREASLAAFCFTTHLGLFGNRVYDWCIYIYNHVNHVRTEHGHPGYLQFFKQTHFQPFLFF